MIAINTNYGNDDDFDREIEKLEAEMMNALHWREELQEEIAATNNLIEVLRTRIEELKRSSPTRFAEMSGKDALLIVMQENRRLHWRHAHRLIVAGGCRIGAQTIKVYLSTGWRYGNDWGTGWYDILW